MKMTTTGERSERSWKIEINTLLAKKSRLSALGQISLVAIAFMSLWANGLGPLGKASLWALCGFNVLRVGLTFFSRQGGWAPETWHAVYFLVTWGTSALWSTISIICLSENGLESSHSLHMLVILAGVVAAASVGLSPHRLLAGTFVLTAIGPVLVWLGSGGPGHLITMAVLFAYLLFLLAQVEIQSRTIIELFSRRDQDRALFDASFEAIMVHDNGRVIDVNGAFEKLFRIAGEKMIGASILTLFPPDDVEAARDRLSIESDEPYICQGRRGDGEIFPMEVRARYFYYQGRQVRLVCAQDVTERVKAEGAERVKVQHEREMSELREKAAIESSRLKSQFLANMSHEIRTPMNAIIAIADLIQSEKLSAEGRRFVRTLRESSESLLSLINDILDYSKIEAGHLQLEKTPLDLADLVESQTDLLAGRALQKKIGLRCHVDPQLPKSVYGDHGRLGQILVNLIGNAIKFTAHGEVIVRCLKLENEHGLVRVRFEIQDSGCGISQEAGRKLFQPFIQADASTARRHGGTGLGLSICKNLVALMNGEIGFDSDGESWTRFWLEVPFEVADAQTISSSYRREAWGDRRCVVLRDSFASTTTVINYLRSWGLLVHEAGMRGSGEILKSADLVVAGAEFTSNLPAEVVAKSIFICPATAEGLKEVTRLPENVRMSDLFNAVNAIFFQGVERPEAKIDEPKDLLFEGARVLIAEDNSTNQMVILALLKRFGIVGRTVGNGEEAVSACLSESFDLVLMDCQMPEVDGWEATERIRRHEVEGRVKDRIRIVALTANATREDRERCLKSGMDDFLSKPVRRAQLAAILKTYLPNRLLATERAS